MSCPPPQVNTSIDHWKTTKWKNINVEQMDTDCKKFAKDVRSLDKEIKAWDAFVGLDNMVKNTITSLRAVSELQNPAIRDRHWHQLMQATQVVRSAAGRPDAGEAGRGQGRLRAFVTWTSHTGAGGALCTQRAPVLRAALCCGRLGIPNNFLTKGPIVFILHRAPRIRQSGSVVS